MSEWAASYIEALTAELSKPDQIDWERKYIAQVALHNETLDLVMELEKQLHGPVAQVAADDENHIYWFVGHEHHGCGTLLYAAPKPDPEPQRPSCDRHPDAPHGFDRTASHNADRYVCECESWTPGDAS